MTKGRKLPAPVPPPLAPAKKTQKLEKEVQPAENEVEAGVEVLQPVKPQHTTLAPMPRAATPKVEEEEKEEKKNKAHPKGHRVFTIEEVREVADGKAPFMRATDTTLLSDIWLVPYHVELPYNGNTWINVSFREIIAGAHIKTRDVAYKISTDDMLMICWKEGCMEALFNGSVPLDFDTWLTEMIYQFSKERGTEDSTNRGKLCEFLINEKKITFCPIEKNKDFTLFFRKINIHSYPAQLNTTEGAGEKVVNYNQVKCSATRGKYEYAWDTRLFLVPDLFEISTLDLPPTQPMD